MENEVLRVGGVVLCGGQSRRMGRSKADLPFGESSLLQRVVKTLQLVVSPIVVVAAKEQHISGLPGDVGVVRDEESFQGPLAGLATGIKPLQDRCDAIYATACDVPLLVPDFVRAMIDRLEDFDLAVPIEDEFAHPLAGVYRTSLLSRMSEILQSGGRRPRTLIDASRSRLVPTAELRVFDSELESLRNLNTPADYEDALRRCGLPSSIGD